MISTILITKSKDGKAIVYTSGDTGVELSRDQIPTSMHNAISLIFDHFEIAEAIAERINSDGKDQG